MAWASPSPGSSPHDSSPLRWTSRLIWLLVGAVFLIWIGVEGDAIWPVLLLAAGVSGAAGLSWLLRRQAATGKPTHPTLVVFAGALAGVATSPIAVLLILIKTSLHDHPMPDFAPADLLAILYAGPAWALAGLCIGGAIVLGLSARDGRTG
jgi:hypothetical protein